MKERKTHEGPRISLVVRGNKTGGCILECLKDMCSSLGKYGVNFIGKKHQIKPFDDPEPIEFTCKSKEATSFFLGSGSKKRKDNLVIGRLYNHKVLDMCEFGIENYKSLASFKVPSSFGKNSKPVILFIGDSFNLSYNLQKIKEMLSDIWKFGDEKEIDVLNIDRLMVFTAISETKIRFNQYYITKLDPNVINGSAEGIETAEVGPSCDMVLRRVKFSDNDVYKDALKKPKVNLKKKRAEKNVTHEKAEGKIGHVHVTQQDISTLNESKRKKKKISN